MKFNIEEEVQTEGLIVNPVKNDVNFTTEIVSSIPNSFDIESVKVHFAQYLEKVDEMYAQAEILTVDNDEGNAQATALGTSAKKLFKKIDAVRHELTEEARPYVKSVDQIAKTLTEKLYSTNEKNITVVSITKEKISQYEAFKEQQRREAELAAKKATEELQKKLDEQARTTGTVAPTVAQPVFPKGKTITRTETGSSYTEREWTFEIVESHYARQLIADLSLLWGKMFNEKDENYRNVTNTQTFYELLKELCLLSPYLVLSDIEIRRAIKGGIRDMGKSINIYQKTNVSFRT